MIRSSPCQPSLAEAPEYRELFNILVWGSCFSLLGYMSDLLLSPANTSLRWKITNFLSAKIRVLYFPQIYFSPYVAPRNLFKVSVHILCFICFRLEIVCDSHKWRAEREVQTYLFFSPFVYLFIYCFLFFLFSRPFFVWGHAVPFFK